MLEAFTNIWCYLDKSQMCRLVYWAGKIFLRLKKKAQETCEGCWCWFWPKQRELERKGSLRIFFPQQIPSRINKIISCTESLTVWVQVLMDLDSERPQMYEGSWSHTSSDRNRMKTYLSSLRNERKCMVDKALKGTKSWQA